MVEVTDLVENRYLLFSSHAPTYEHKGTELTTRSTAKMILYSKGKSYLARFCGEGEKTRKNPHYVSRQSAAEPKFSNGPY